MILDSLPRWPQGGDQGRDLTLTAEEMRHAVQ